MTGSGIPISYVLFRYARMWQVATRQRSIVTRLLPPFGPEGFRMRPSKLSLLPLVYMCKVPQRGCDVVRYLHCHAAQSPISRIISQLSQFFENILQLHCSLLHLLNYKPTICSGIDYIREFINITALLVLEFKRAVSVATIN